MVWPCSRQIKPRNCLIALGNTPYGGVVNREFFAGAPTEEVAPAGQDGRAVL